MRRDFRIGPGIGTIVILIAALAGCQKSLGPGEASSIINAHSFFQSVKYFDVPRTVGKTTPCDVYGADKPGWRQMIDMNYATSHETDSGKCELQLTDAGQSASAKWQTADGVWKVPIASKTFMRVEKIDYGLGDTTGVLFSWRYVPTPFGQRLPSSSSTLEKGVAQFRHTPNGWEIASIQ